MCHHYFCTACCILSDSQYRHETISKERLPSKFGETIHGTPSLRMKYGSYTLFPRSRIPACIEIQ